MLAPLSGALLFGLSLLLAPPSVGVDPGPSPLCPPDMRLVSGTHAEEVEHTCVDVRRDKKHVHCYAYLEDVTVTRGPRTSVHVCMDQFEAPNRRGAKPLVMVSYREATRWCAARGKRLCTEQEWELACEGPEHLPLAYGWRVDVKRCNSNKVWLPFDAAALRAGGETAKREVERLWQGSPSGARRGCVSPFGIVDMMGNVEEWVTSRPARRWPGALMGGFWAKPWTGCRGTNDAHEPTFRFYEAGFRCCAEPRAPPGSGRRRRRPGRRAPPLRGETRVCAGRPARGASRGAKLRP